MLCGSISRNKYPDFPHIPEKRSPYRMHYQNASEQMFPPENDQRTALLLAYNLFPNGDQLETFSASLTSSPVDSSFQCQLFKSPA